VSKDRAAPFSRKHRRYWLPVTGGMLLIGAINLGLGYCAYEPPPPEPEKIPLVLPASPYAVDAGVDAAVDTGLDVGADVTPR
jgi:hypothetical protein